MPRSPRGVDAAFLCLPSAIRALRLADSAPVRAVSTVQREARAHRAAYAIHDTPTRENIVEDPGYMEDLVHHRAPDPPRSPDPPR